MQSEQQSRARRRVVLLIVALCIVVALPVWGLFAWYFRDSYMAERSLQGHELPVESVAYFPDGRFAVSGGRDKTVRVWDLRRGQEIARLEGHADQVASVAVSADGKRILSGGGDFYGSRLTAPGTIDCTVRLWDAVTGEQLHCFEGHVNEVSSVAFSPDGRLGVSGSGDTTVRLWDLGSGEQVHCFEGHTDWVRAVTFSPDGRFVMSGGNDRTIRLWDVASGEEVRRFEESGWVSSLAFSADGRRALSGHDEFAYAGRRSVMAVDRGVRLWDVERGRELWRFDADYAVVNVAFDPTEERVLGGLRRSVRVWDIKSRSEVQRVGFWRFTDSNAGDVAFSPDRGHVVTADNDGVVRLWKMPW